jgi:hypothetical protein
VRKYLNISVLCCLFALAANVVYGVSLNHTGYDFTGYGLYDHPASDHDESTLFSTPQPFQIFSEISPESHSEILPERSDNAGHRGHDYAYAPRIHYLAGAQILLTGQDPRNLIYPFHFFL